MKSQILEKSLSALAAKVASAKQIAALSSAPASDLAPVAWLKVLIAYEDFATGQRAMKICGNLIDQLGQKFQFRTSLWKFDLLRVTKLNAIATQDADAADLVFISAHDRGDLPAEVRKWLAAWQSQPLSSAKALVALLERTDERARVNSPVHSYLQAFAVKARFDFFSQTVAALPPRRETFSERLGWRINE